MIDEPQKISVPLEREISEVADFVVPEKLCSNKDSKTICTHVCKVLSKLEFIYVHYIFCYYYCWGKIYIHMWNEVQFDDIACSFQVVFNYSFLVENNNFWCNLNAEGKMKNKIPSEVDSIWFSNWFIFYFKSYLRVKEYKITFVTCEFQNLAGVACKSMKTCCFCRIFLPCNHTWSHSHAY